MNRHNYFKKIMAITVFSLFLSLKFASAGGDISSDIKSADYPHIKYSYEIHLISAMSKALQEYSLKRYSSEFRIFNMEDYAEDMRYFPPSEVELSSKTCYSALFGDFNGDKRIDAAVFGESDYWIEGLPGEGKFERFPILALLSEGMTGYRASIVAAAPAYRPTKTFLKLMRPQVIKKIETGEKFALKHDAIGLGWWGGYENPLLG